LTSIVSPSGLAICIVAITPAPNAVIEATRAALSHLRGVGASSANIALNPKSSTIGPELNQSIKLKRKVIRVKSSMRVFDSWVSPKWLLSCLASCCVALSACTAISERPEFDPERWAPRTAQTEWSPAASGQQVSIDVESTVEQFKRPAVPSSGGKGYDLPGLIDLALLQNPDTRGAWEAARVAAAGWAIKRAPFYPLLSVSSESGYERAINLTPKHWGTLKNWQSVDLLRLDYILVDFGRRDAAAESAREQLAAANVQFNRTIQTTIFAVEKNFYLLDAERAGLDAAHAVVALAETDLRAVQRRHAAGLATKPDVLLAQQRQAQALYELQDAELGVRDAQADLATAVGLQVNSMPNVQSAGIGTLPAALNASVDDLIHEAMQQRPDLAASVMSLRAKQAEVELARANMYPLLDLSSDYGSHAFNYTLSNPPTPQYTAMAPEYAAMLTLKWDVFAGMEYVNSIEQAKNARENERAQIRALQIDVAGQVWRAYYAFETAARKYRYAEALLAASQSAYDSNLRSFNLGLATIVDLLAAQRDLADAEYTIIRSRADVLISAAAVAYSVGIIGPR
jgi:outer membrane protein TolC